MKVPLQSRDKITKVNHIKAVSEPYSHDIDSEGMHSEYVKTDIFC